MTAYLQETNTLKQTNYQFPADKVSSLNINYDDLLKHLTTVFLEGRSFIPVTGQSVSWAFSFMV